MTSPQHMLTPYAAEALRHAQEVAAVHHGAEAVSPLHLLEGLLQITDGNADRLLAQLGVSTLKLHAALAAEPPPSPGSPPPLSPELDLLLDRVREQARLRSSAQAGTEHMLLALLAADDSQEAQLLAELGVTYRRVSETMDLLRQEQENGKAPPPPPGDRCADPRPPVVRIAGYVLGTCAALGFLCPLPSFVGSSFAVPLTWLVLCCAALAYPMAAGRKWAWGAVCGFLLIKAAVIIGVLAALYQQVLQLGTAPVELKVVSLGLLILEGSCVSLLVGLFRARSWYGVRRRETWQTLWRQGWWTLIPTALLDLFWLFTLHERR